MALGNDSLRVASFSLKVILTEQENFESFEQEINRLDRSLKIFPEVHVLCHYVYALWQNIFDYDGVQR